MSSRLQNEAYLDHSQFYILIFISSLVFKSKLIVINMNSDGYGVFVFMYEQVGYGVGRLWLVF